MRQVQFRARNEMQAPVQSEDQLEWITSSAHVLNVRLFIPLFICLVFITAKDGLSDMPYQLEWITSNAHVLNVRSPRRCWRFCWVIITTQRCLSLTDLVR